MPDRIDRFLRVRVSGHRQLETLVVRKASDGSAVQDRLKPRHFLEKILAGAHRTARQVSKLKMGDEKLGAALAKNTLRLERMGDVHLRDSSRIQDERQ